MNSLCKCGGQYYFEAKQYIHLLTLFTMIHLATVFYDYEVCKYYVEQYTCADCGTTTIKGSI